MDKKRIITWLTIFRIFFVLVLILTIGTTVARLVIDGQFEFDWLLIIALIPAIYLAFFDKGIAESAKNPQPKEQKKRKGGKQNES